jgi:putative PIN family toxin of toxin-antitoxin system
MPIQIVIDTNVFVSALRSKRGASYKLLSMVGESSKFEINLSVPLVLEYEDAAYRSAIVSGLSTQDIDDILDYLCSVANRRRIFFLWRPQLRDPKDDMVLEVAVESHCDYVITFNKKDFTGIEEFGIRALTPQEFLKKLGEI